jgi:signal transduction histidine kinase
LPVIKGDRFRLQQLFQNLIGNALSHNDKNSALIVVDCKEEVDYYVFSVTDNGPGIAKENQEKILIPFNP